MTAPQHSRSTEQQTSRRISRIRFAGARALRVAISARSRAVLTLGVVLGLGAVGTLAAWSDTATATSGAFSTGSVDIQLNNDQGNPTAYAFATLNMPNLLSSPNKSIMLPGNSVAATLPVQNKGSLAFGYTLAASATGVLLAPYLTVAVYTGATASNTAATGTCGGTGSSQIGTGTTLSTSGSVPLIAISRALGATTGAETLCFVVTLSSSAPTTVQSETATATFVFTATAS